MPNGAIKSRQMPIPSGSISGNGKNQKPAVPSQDIGSEGPEARGRNVAPDITEGTSDTRFFWSTMAK